MQYYLECLSQASYLIGDETSGRAVVVDPRRDVAEYIDDARSAGLHIDYVIETHVHADFLSGHLELAEATGATVIYGAGADLEFPYRQVGDGDVIDLGSVRLEILATPGHTPESISVVVWEDAAAAAPYGVLTGDALFIGDVGRPDLVAASGFSADEMARQLFDSIHSQLLTLPDETRVYPAHGAGSACGKNLSTETMSTIGEQRDTNYALRLKTVEEFVAAVTEGQPPRPDYFTRVVALNREQHPLLHAETLPPLSVDQALRLQSAGAVILDVRAPETFARGHVVNSINVGLEGRFAEYVADVLEPNPHIVLVIDADSALEARVRLSRVGLDKVEGVIDDPAVAFAEQPAAIQISSRVTAAQLAAAETDLPTLAILDIRSSSERDTGYIEGSIHIPLVQLRERAAELDPERPWVVYCGGGYRSSIAASLLRSCGFRDVSDLIGGYQAWAAA